GEGIFAATGNRLWARPVGAQMEGIATLLRAYLVGSTDALLGDLLFTRYSFSGIPAIGGSDATFDQFSGMANAGIMIAGNGFNTHFYATDFYAQEPQEVGAAILPNYASNAAGYELWGYLNSNYVMNYSVQLAGEDIYFSYWEAPPSDYLLFGQQNERISSELLRGISSPNFSDPATSLSLENFSYNVEFGYLF
ncbi:hypothetical protein C9988_04870, partial [Pseudidiomarina aestuarii]